MRVLRHYAKCCAQIALCHVTNIDIPEGFFWNKASNLRRAKCIAYSSILGWPRKMLPDFGLAGHI